MKRFLAAFAGNNVFANIFKVLILMAGLIAALSMIRESFPEMSLDSISISVLYPGADPEEVEEGICRKIEEEIKGMEGIKEFTSHSSENMGSVIVEVKEGYDVDDVLTRVKTKVEAIPTFPVDAENPVVEEIIINRQTISLALLGDMSERRLKEWAEKIKEEIQNLPQVTQVSILGTRDYEINIEVSEERLREYGLTFSQVTDAVRRSNMNLAGGTIRTKGEEIRVRTLGRKYTGREISSIVVMARPEGEIITLGRLARIDDGFTEDHVSIKVDGERTVIVNVYNTLEEDALTISQAVRAYLEKKEQQLPEGLTIKILSDETDMLRSRFDLLIKNGMIGLFIVFMTLWAFMNTRVSVWCGMGIPISVAGGMLILWISGGTLNMMSLFAFIMVLGIVVDDAIVVGEAIYVHRKEGDPPLKAAVEGVSEVGMPVIAAVLTSVVAFIPLTNVGGVFGGFVYCLPVVVIACLMTSLLDSLILLPAHLNDLPDTYDPESWNSGGKRPNPLSRGLILLQNYTGNKMERFVERVYIPFLSKTLKWRYISLCSAITLLFLTIGLIRGGIIKYSMFPKADGFRITSTLKFPDGTPQEVVQGAVDKVQNAVKLIGERTKTISGEPLIRHTTATVGQTLSFRPETSPNVGAVQATLLPSEDRGVHSQDLAVMWEKEVGGIPGIESLTYEGGGFGPPGAPIEIWVQGHDMKMILNAADELIEWLHRYDGVYQVRSDFAPGKNEIRLNLKPEARAFVLTVDDLARQVNAGYYGSEALRLQRGRDDIRVKVRYTEEERTRLTGLEQIRIRTPGGLEVPLISVADFHYAPGYSTITRTNGMRRIQVSAEVDPNIANTREIMGELTGNYLTDFKHRYPDLNISIQGEQEHDRETFGSLLIGFPLAIIGIFIIIATMFRSYLQPFIILFTVPFGIIGAILGHLVLGFDLGIMSAFGIIALTGIVVNSAIVLIDRVNTNISKGMSFFDAVQTGAARRFRAVFLTTISTVGGLAPLILETDFQAHDLVPMAISIAAGVLFATLLTLILIPSLLTILNDFRQVIYKVKNGRWPSREEVEPSSKIKPKNQDVLSGTDIIHLDQI